MANKVENLQMNSNRNLKKMIKSIENKSLSIPNLQYIHKNNKNLLTM